MLDVKSKYVYLILNTHFTFSQSFSSINVNIVTWELVKIPILMLTTSQAVFMLLLIHGPHFVKLEETFIPPGMSELSVHEFR